MDEGRGSDLCTVVQVIIFNIYILTTRSLEESYIWYQSVCPGKAEEDGAEASRGKSKSYGKYFGRS